MSDDIVKFGKKSGSSILAAMKENPEKVGGILLRIATERADSDFTAAVIARVKELVTHRNNLQLALEKTQKEIDLFDTRIAAIEGGEFTVDGYGAIHYKDSSLNYR